MKRPALIASVALFACVALSVITAAQLTGLPDIAFATIPQARPGAAGYGLNNPKLPDAGQVTDFYDRAARNTKYVIHPEEIPAENFRLLLLAKTDVASQQIPRDPVLALGRPRGQ
jgi:hypothetical protein